MSEDTAPKQKRKRANYTADEDAFIIQEAYANKACCQLNKQGELFTDIAQKLNESGTCEDFSEEDRNMADMVSDLDEIDEEKEALRKAKKEEKDKKGLVDDKVLFYTTNRGGVDSLCLASVENTKHHLTNDDEEVTTNGPIHHPASKRQRRSRKARNDSYFQEMMHGKRQGDAEEMKSREEERKDRAAERQFQRKERARECDERCEDMKMMQETVLKATKK